MRQFQPIPMSASWHAAMAGSNCHRSKSKQPLTRLEQLNVQMDKAAKQRLATVRRSPPMPNLRLGNESMMVMFQGNKLSCINKQKLYQEIYGKHTKAKWVSLHKIPPHLVDNNIAWDELHKAFKREPLGKKCWLCKHCAKQCSVGKCMER